MNLTKFPIYLAIFVLILDIGTKYLVQAHIPLLDNYSYYYPYHGIPVFEDLGGVEFAIIHAINYGAAWGILAGYQYYLIIFRIALILGIGIFLLFFNKSSIMKIPLALVMAGAIGNVLDYFIYGHVIDMFHFVLWGYHYPVFNVADSAICVGVFSAILISSFSNKNEVGCSNG